VHSFTDRVVNAGWNLHLEHAEVERDLEYGGDDGEGGWYEQEYEQRGDGGEQSDTGLEQDDAVPIEPRFAI
jgi:hypothetical protein